MHGGMRPHLPFIGGGTGPSLLFMHGGTGPSSPFMDGGVGPCSPFMRGGAGSLFTVRGTGCSSLLIGGGAGRLLFMWYCRRHLWMVLPGAHCIIHGWWWWALVAPFVGGTGAPLRFSCAMVRVAPHCGPGCHSRVRVMGCCSCLWVLIVVHGCLWAVIAVCALFEVVAGSSIHLLGDVALPRPSCCGGCGRWMCGGS